MIELSGKAQTPLRAVRFVRPQPKVAADIQYNQSCGNGNNERHDGHWISPSAISCYIKSNEMQSFKERIGIYSCLNEMGGMFCGLEGETSGKRRISFCRQLRSVIGSDQCQHWID
jgi:hypothetical protein